MNNRTLLLLILPILLILPLVIPAHAYDILWSNGDGTNNVFAIRNSAGVDQIWSDKNNVMWYGPGNYPVFSSSGVYVRTSNAGGFTENIVSPSGLGANATQTLATASGTILDTNGVFTGTCSSCALSGTVTGSPTLSGAITSTGGITMSGSNLTMGVNSITGSFIMTGSPTVQGNLNTANVLINGGALLRFTDNSNDQYAFSRDGATGYFTVTPTQDVFSGYSFLTNSSSSTGSATPKLTIGNTGDLIIGAQKKIFFDGTVAGNVLDNGNNYIVESSANVMDWYAGGIDSLELTGGSSITSFVNTKIQNELDIGGNNLVYNFVLYDANNNRKLIQNSGNTLQIYNSAANQALFLMADNGNISLFSKLIVYNNTATTGEGVPAIFNSTLNKAETGADPNLVTFIPPASKGEYRIHFSMNVKTATSAVVGWTVSYKDAEGDSVAPTNLSLFQTGTAVPALTFTTSSASNYYGDTYIDIDNSATKIIVKTTSSGTLTTAMASATIEKIQ